MSDLYQLTLVLGPHSRTALSLNDLVRSMRAPLRRAGVNAMPNRVASPLLRRSLEVHRPPGERRAEFCAQVGQGASVLSAVGMFGPAQNGLQRGALLPNAADAVKGLDDVLGPVRVVVCLDSLTRFFLATGSDVLEARVRRQEWESLYELSWVPFVEIIREAFPESEVIVLTPRTSAVRSPVVLERLLGAETVGVVDPLALLKRAVTQTGVAVLDRMLKDGVPDEATLNEVYDSFAETPTQDDLLDRLGVDKLTATLLDQRFEEDVAKLETLSSVETL